MATAAICGTGGSVTGVSGVTEVKNWNIDRSIEAQEATSFSSSGWKEFVACLKRGTGSFISIGGPGTVGPASATFKTATAGCTISGNIIISKITVEVDVNSIVTYTHDFVFTGAITVS
jgi:hypothetical protein